MLWENVIKIHIFNFFNSLDVENKNETYSSNLQRAQLWSGTFRIKSFALKINLLRFCARITFLARANVLRQPLGHIQKHFI